MNYEKDVKKLSIKYIDRFIKTYKENIINVYNSKDSVKSKVDKILYYLYIILYKTDYFFNIVDFKDDSTTEDIINSLNGLCQEIKEDTFIPNIKINEFIKNHKPSNKYYDFYNFYLNIVYASDEEKRINHLLNKIDSFNFPIFDISFILPSNYEHLTVSTIIEDSIYNIEEDEEKESKLNITLNYDIFNFLIKRIKDKEKRKILINIFNNSLLTINNNESLLYSIINYWILRGFKDNINSYLLDIPSFDINNFTNSFNYQLNEKYIKNYINIFEAFEPKTNIINISDLTFYIHDYKKKIKKDIGFINYVVILNYIKEILETFNIIIEDIEDGKFNIFYNTGKDKILIAQWQIIFNDTKRNQEFKILFNRINMVDGKTNIIYLIFELNCEAEKIDFGNLYKLFGFIGKAFYYSLTFNDSLTTVKNKADIFKTLFMLIFINNIDKLFIEDMEKIDLILNYIESDFIFKYKKYLLDVNVKNNIFKNQKFLSKIQKIINKEDESNIIGKINNLFIESYIKIFSNIYNTENYSINPNIFNVFTNLDNKKPYFNSLNKIFSDIYAYELFYNYYIKKLPVNYLLDFINNKIEIEKVIKRQPKFETLINQTPNVNKSYGTLTEGINKIFDFTTTASL